ncbi:hypothetical protein D3C81_2100070 [compost metagenome]
MLRFAQGNFRRFQSLLQLRLALSQFGILPGVRGDLRGQWRQQGIEFAFARELMPLRAELLQSRQFHPLAGQTFRMLLRAVQLLGGRLLRVLQHT